MSLAPHCPLGPIALAASLQVDFASPNALIQEQSLGIHYNVGNDLLDYLVDPSVFACIDGYVARPTAPGLGIEVDEAAVRRAAETGARVAQPDLAARRRLVRGVVTLSATVLLAALRRDRLVAIVRGRDREATVAAALTLVECGITTVEISLSGADALAAHGGRPGPRRDAMRSWAPGPSSRPTTRRPRPRPARGSP